MLGMINVVPPQAEGEPQGWRYPQEIRDHKQWIEGSDYNGLITKVTKFRIANNISLGNPENDIDAYYCNRWPNYCAPTAGRLPPPRTQPRTFRERVTSWAANRYEHAGAIALVNQETADSRAAICAECPYNKTWREGCPPCIEQTDRTLVLIRQAKTTNPSIMGCIVSGQDNTTAAFLPEKFLRHRNKFEKELWPKCWMLSLKADE